MIFVSVLYYPCSCLRQFQHTSDTFYQILIIALLLQVINPKHKIEFL